jgi:hypothetical protein
MGKSEVNTPYDDVFKTLLNDCTSLIIPVVNEIFGEDYRGDEMIKFLPNEHFINQPEGNTEKEFTDSCFEIYGREHKKYHLECQSTTDSSMLIRMFELPCIRKKLPVAGSVGMMRRLHLIADQVRGTI